MAGISFCVAEFGALVYGMGRTDLCTSQEKVISACKQWYFLSSVQKIVVFALGCVGITMWFGLVWVLLLQAFAAWRGWGANSAATLLAGCLFLRLSWQWIVLSRLGVALLSFVLVSWCDVCFWVSPFRLLTRQLRGSDCACRQEFNIIRLENNSIYLKPDESFVHSWGKSFDFMTPARQVSGIGVF